jgi:hypothetical protein
MPKYGFIGYMQSIDFGTKDIWCRAKTAVHKYLYKSDTFVPLSITPQCHFAFLGSPSAQGPSEVNFQDCGPAHYFICMFTP